MMYMLVVVMHWISGIFSSQYSSSFPLFFAYNQGNYCISFRIVLKIVSYIRENGTF
jgi:hypothetical protein